MIDLYLKPEVMFMVAAVLLTWLGFRFADVIGNDLSTARMAKIASSVYFFILAMVFDHTVKVAKIMASAATD